MTDDPSVQPEEIVPAENIPAQPSLTFVERYNIPPPLFALLALFVVFIGYQFIGAVVTYLLFGLEPTEENIQGFRVVTALSQLFLILVPTLFFGRLVSAKPRDFFRVKFPGFRALLLPIIGIVSLQQMLQVYMIFQSRIPLPQEIQTLVDQLNELIERLTKMLAGSDRKSTRLNSSHRL